MYELVKFLHVAAAVVWVGGGTWSYILIRRLQAAGAGPALGPVQAQVGWFGKTVLTPASILALFTGLYLVLAGGFDPEQAWIAIGLVGLLATVAVGMGLISPSAAKVGRLVAEHGPGHADVARLQARMRAATVFNLVVLWAILVVMVLRPGS